MKKAVSILISMIAGLMFINGLAHSVDIQNGYNQKVYEVIDQVIGASGSTTFQFVNIGGATQMLASDCTSTSGNVTTFNISYRDQSGNEIESLTGYFGAALNNVKWGNMYVTIDNPVATPNTIDCYFKFDFTEKGGPKYKAYEATISTAATWTSINVTPNTMEQIQITDFPGDGRIAFNNVTGNYVTVEYLLGGLEIPTDTDEYITVINVYSDSVTGDVQIRCPEGY